MYLKLSQINENQRSKDQRNTSQEGGRKSTNISAYTELSRWGHGHGLVKVKIIAVLPRPQHRLSSVCVGGGDHVHLKDFVEDTYQHMKGLIVCPCGYTTKNYPILPREELSKGGCFLPSLMRYPWFGNNSNAQQ